MSLGRLIPGHRLTVLCAPTDVASGSAKQPSRRGLKPQDGLHRIGEVLWAAGLDRKDGYLKALGSIAQPATRLDLAAQPNCSVAVLKASPFMMRPSDAILGPEHCSTGSVEHMQPAWGTQGSVA